MSRPLVLLHGYAGGPSSWDQVLAAMPLADRRVVRPWLLGHGAKPHGDGVGCFDEEVDRIAAALRAAGISGAHLAGYSLGGRVALGLLVRHCALFARATIVSASPGLADEGERAARVEADERWARLLETDGLTSFVDTWEEQPLFATQRRLPDSVRAAERERRLSHRPEGLARAMRTLGLGRMPDLRPHLAALTVPIRLMAGSDDAKFCALAQEMAERLPRARLDLALGAGHNLLIERPDAVASALLEDA